jgi:ABC-type multidrug transport system ATPase subunit
MIEVKNLSKYYNKFQALDNVNLVCKPGKITILLGENGAGKSTTIKSIASLLKFKGEINVCNFPNYTIEAKKNFGYIPEVPMLYDLLTINEHIKFITNAYSVENNEELVEKYIKLFKLEDKRNKMAKELSKGMRQKLSMLLTFIIEPEAILIDEPMIGLDPTSIEDTIDIIKGLKDDGKSLLISTHIIDMFEDVYDEAYILDHGKIIKYVSKDEVVGTTLKEIFFGLVNGEKDEVIN